MSTLKKMDELLTIRGHFSHAAEAQQAVQLLLAVGFAPDRVAVWTQPQLSVTAGQLPGATTDADRRSGRFLTALFGERSLTSMDQSRPGHPAGGDSTPGAIQPGAIQPGASPGRASPGRATPRRATPRRATPRRATWW